MATMLDAAGGSTSFNSTRLHVLQSTGNSCRTTVAQGVAPAVADATTFGGISSSNSNSSRSSSHLLATCTGFRRNFSRTSAPLRSTSRRSGTSAYRKARTIVSEAQETITAAGVVNDGTFRSLVLESEIPVLVDFWAPWCGPCRMIAPIIDELAKQYAGKLRCLKMNTDESPSVAAEYGIRSIPTVLLFVGGQKRDTVIGAVPKSTLIATIDKYIEV